MTVRTASVFTCDLCKTTDTSRIDDSYEVPSEWMTVRVTISTDAAGTPNAHLCPSCKYEPVLDIWEKVF